MKKYKTNFLNEEEKRDEFQASFKVAKWCSMMFV